MYSSSATYRRNNISREQGDEAMRRGRLIHSTRGAAAATGRSGEGDGEREGTAAEGDGKTVRSKAT